MNQGLEVKMAILYLSKETRKFVKNNMGVASLLLVIKKSIKKT